MMLPVDHLFALLLFVIQPIYGALSYRRYLRKISAGEPANTTKLYRETLVAEWIALAVLAITWYVLGRSATALGLVSPTGTNFYIGIAVLALVSGLLFYSRHKVRRMTDDEKAQQIESLGDVVHLVPRNQRDHRYFFGLSITAGICEEIIYRGFVIWYLAQLMPLWGAVVVSSILFGLAHSYQGAAGIARTGLMGLCFGIFYIFTGSIWLPIIGHAILDIIQGKTISELFCDNRQDCSSSEQPSQTS